MIKLYEACYKKITQEAAKNWREGMAGGAQAHGQERGTRVGMLGSALTWKASEPITEQLAAGSSCLQGPIFQARTRAFTPALAGTEALPLQS